ncbi:MAG: hypothetical protein AB4911_00730 [Oscillochloridaceae bacterium umkhey_bin13]
MDVTKQQSMSTMQTRGLARLSDRAAQFVAAIITVGVAGSVAYGINALFMSWAG